MKWNEIPAGKVNGAIQRFQVELGNEASDIFDRIMNSDHYVYRLAKSAYLDGFEQLPSQVATRQTMKENMFGVEDAYEYLGVRPSKEQLEDLAHIPFSNEDLVACKDSHVLIAVFPMSIMDIKREAIRNRKGSLIRFEFDTDSSDDKLPFLKDKGQVGWYLIPKIPDTKSNNLPNARILIYAMIGHAWTAGKLLFHGNYVQCSDKKHGSRVEVGMRQGSNGKYEIYIG